MHHLATFILFLFNVFIIASMLTSFQYTAGLEPMSHESFALTPRPVVLNLFKAATPFSSEYLFATPKNFMNTTAIGKLIYNGSK